MFDLIAVRGRDLCGAYGATVIEYDGTLMHHRAFTGISDDPVRRQAVIDSFPTPPTARRPSARAILERRVIQIDDLDTEYDRTQLALPDVKTLICVPMFRGDTVIGVLSMGGHARGAVSATQIELLTTFAEQAVIAITSAETYRTLQTRTADLQESLENTRLLTEQ